jgi:photosystem II stability/assembly factor-like uncharacterized protein
LYRWFFIRGDLFVQPLHHNYSARKTTKSIVRNSFKKSFNNNTTLLNFQNMKKLALIFFLSLITVMEVSSQTWEKINTGFNYIFKGIEFPAGQSQIGFAGGQHLTYNGNGIVIKTTDGGTTWSQLWFGTQQGIEGISFTDLNTGYVCGWSHYFAKTTDGGLTWVTQNPGPVADVWYYNDVIFKDALHGVVTAAGNIDPKVYITNDGGATWTEGTGLVSVPYSICYVSDNTYFLVTNGGEIQKSIDGGLTWNTVISGLGLLLGVNFYNPMIGIATGEDGWIHKTYDGGVTWSHQQTAFGNPLWRSTAWVNQNELVMVGTPETIWRSLDGGSNWFNDYPATTYNPALYDVHYTPDGFTYVCGSQGWFYRKSPLFIAAFTTSATTICNGSTVQFTDQSIGSPTAYNWTFEGGTPATSTLPSPLVTYSTPGVYDVTLVITNNTQTNTSLNPDLIHVDGPLSLAPTQPSGSTSICGGFNYNYTTTSVPNATSYVWTIDPASSGTITGNGLTATVAASNSWTGNFTVKVNGISICGAGPISPVLNCTLSHQPVVFSLFSGGGYCAGQAGFQIRLEDSELGVNYQLYKNGIASGAPLAGTGNELSFGLQPTGDYTVTAVNGSCSAAMQGTATVFMIDPVAAATQPTGPTSVCNNSPATFTASLPANGFTLVWTLVPASAGVITQPSTTTASVAWNSGFSGAVAITVQGQNECGTGAASPALNVTVNALPVPAINGIATVCKTQSINYTTTLNTGSSYVWTVTGGTITSGQGSNQVTVLWGNPGNGTLTVSETSAANCTGSSAVFTVAINECTGIDEDKAVGFSIYPNPASDILNLKVNAATKLNISIYNHLGQVVYHSEGVKASDYSEVRISISNLKSGTYTLRAICENEVFSKIFVKN